MNCIRLSARERGQRIVLALIFTIIDASIMIVLSPWVPVPRLGWINDYLARIGVSGVLLVVALLARRSERFGKYWQVLFALFILTVAISLELVFGTYMIKQLGIIDTTPAVGPSRN